MRAFLSQFSDYYFCYATDKLISIVSYFGNFRIGLTIFIADNRLFKFHLTGGYDPKEMNWENLLVIHCVPC